MQKIIENGICSLSIEFIRFPDS